MARKKVWGVRSAGARDRGTATRAPVARRSPPARAASRIPARLPPNLFSHEPAPAAERAPHRRRSSAACKRPRALTPAVLLLHMFTCLGALLRLIHIFYNLYNVCVFMKCYRKILFEIELLSFIFDKLIRTSSFTDKTSVRY